MEYYKLMQTLYNPEITFIQTIFDQLCESLYTYQNICVNNNELDCIYWIAEYFEDIIFKYNANDKIEVINKVFTFIDTYKNYSDAMKSERERIRKLALDFCHDAFSETYTSIEDTETPTMDIQYSFGLKRHTYKPEPPEIQHPKISGFVSDFTFVREMNRRIYLYHEAYVTKLMFNMNQLKYEIIKYELSRYGKQVGGPIDIIIYENILTYIKIQKDFNMWLNKMNRLNIDQYFLHKRKYDRSEPDLYKQVLYYKMTGNRFCHKYNLPMSVLKYFVENPSHWDDICSKKCSFSGKKLPLPKMYKGQLCIY